MHIVNGEFLDLNFSLKEATGPVQQLQKYRLSPGDHDSARCPGHSGAIEDVTVNMKDWLLWACKSLGTPTEVGGIGISMLSDGNKGRAIITHASKLPHVNRWALLPNSKLVLGTMRGVVTSQPVAL
ncbi:hypothetical protein AMTR_s00047p00054720 [Amborella trichopoda]|uniref:Uncharacterized protein n=1 Tax=Amborella trichopoda TaxID=13333 RepID=U5D8H6_AMBTC|nr:hypothetical protein AMTR_s00047p00054720 [Amborella trichopoda]